MNAHERRKAIIELLAVRKHCSVDSLAAELGVCRRTILRDVSKLSQSFPLYTAPGPHGGIHILDGYRLSRRELTHEQKELLEKVKPTLPENERIIIQSILRDFAPSDVF